VKQNALGMVAGVSLIVLALNLPALPLFGQKDFNVDEKKLIDAFKRANPFYLGGAELFASGKLDKAEKKLLECLKTMPGHADASYLLAQVHLKRKELPQALEAITTAEKNYAANARLQNFSHQDYLDRLRQQRQGLETQRSQIEQKIQALGGSNNAEKGRLEQEVQLFVQSIREIDRRLNSPVAATFEIPADYRYIHGNILFQMGAPLDAAARYREAIRLDPRHGNAYNNLALVAFSQRKYREALDYLLQAEAAGAKVNPEFKNAIESRLPPQ